MKNEPKKIADEIVIRNFEDINKLTLNSFAQTLTLDLKKISADEQLLIIGLLSLSTRLYSSIKTLKILGCNFEDKKLQSNTLKLLNSGKSIISFELSNCTSEIGGEFTKNLINAVKSLETFTFTDNVINFIAATYFNSELPNFKINNLKLDFKFNTVLEGMVFKLKQEFISSINSYCNQPNKQLKIYVNNSNIKLAKKLIDIVDVLKSEDSIEKIPLEDYAAFRYYQKMKPGLLLVHGNDKSIIKKIDDTITKNLFKFAGITKSSKFIDDINQVIAGYLGDKNLCEINSTIEATELSGQTQHDE